MIRFPVKPVNILWLGLILTIGTTAVFLFSIRNENYYFCAEYSCFDFFFSNFSTFIKIIATEAGVISFAVALATLDAAGKSIALAAESNHIARKTAQYEMFTRIVEFEQRRSEILSDVSINEPLLFQSLLTSHQNLLLQDNRNASGGIKSIRDVIKNSNAKFGSADGCWDRDIHIEKMLAAFESIGLLQPEADPDTQLTIEGLCIQLINSLDRLLSILLTTSSANCRELLPKPIYLPAHTIE